MARKPAAQRCVPSLGALVSLLLRGAAAQQPLTVREWDVLGPFPVGKTEVDADPLQPFGGVEALKRGDRRAEFFSEVAAQGVVRWSKARSDAAGSVGVQFNAVNWNQHVQWMDTMMVLETQTFLLGDLRVPADGDYLLQATGVHSFAVDGVLCHGDIYSGGALRTPLALTAGTHTVSVRFRARASGQFRFRATPAQADAALRLSAPEFSPDLSAGALFGEWLPLPVLNAGTDFIEELRVEVASGGELELHPQYMQPSDAIAPGVLLAIPVRLALAPGAPAERLAASTSDSCAAVELTVSGVLASSRQPVRSRPQRLSLRCRRAGQVFLFGFLDHDGSVAHAAAIPPRAKPTDELDGVGVMLSFSGVGVAPQQQAESHKYMPKKAKEFVFGYKNMWTLAPERNGAHNWEGVGARTAVTALDALTHLSAATAFPITSADRVHVTGHSRGGHGALVFAVNRPDR